MLAQATNACSYIYSYESNSNADYEDQSGQFQGLWLYHSWVRTLDGTRTVHAGARRGHLMRRVRLMQFDAGFYYLIL